MTMTITPVTARRVDDHPALRDDLLRARVLARLLDAQFEILGIKLGLDALIGLIPVIGDAVSTGLGFYLVHIAHKHRLGTSLIIQMLVNLFVDWLVGVIPGVGDVADVFFRANLRNLALLEAAAAKRGVTV